MTIYRIQIIEPEIQAKGIVNPVSFYIAYAFDFSRNVFVMIKV